MINSKNEFLFAITSINVSYFLKVYFHCAKLSYYKYNKKQLCSRKALKTFCKFLIQDKKCIEKLHNFILEILFSNWIYLKKKFFVDIMQFQVCMDHVKKQFKLVFENRNYNTLHDFM